MKTPYRTSFSFPVRVIFLSLFLLFTGREGQPQCPPGDITLFNQFQVDNFSTNYPGCTELNGGLIINNTNVANLDGLSSLTSIGGNLYLGNNSNLTGLDGLTNITSIGGYLFIYNNPSLMNLDGLTSLTSIGGYLYIDENSSLMDLDGLSHLSYIDKYLEIRENANLTDLDGLSGLTSVEGLSIVVNSSLTNLDGLSGLTSVTGIIIGSNSSLANLDGLSNITSIDRNLHITINSSLTDLDGLSGLASIGGSLTIGINSSLTNLGGLSNLISIGGFLNIYNNSILTNLDGLSRLASVNWYLRIIGNSIITNLDGLENIDPAGITDLFIQNNSNLSVCTAANICRYLADGGSAVISGNAEGCASIAEVENACLSAMPLVLTDYEVQPDHPDVTVRWHSPAAFIAEGFVVEHSQDGISWESVSKMLSPTDFSGDDFTYRHKDPGMGRHFYRLRHYDRDGAENIGPVESVFLDSDKGISLYPNPASDYILLSGIGNGFEYEIRSVLGEKLRSGCAGEAPVDVSGLIPGIYLFVLTDRRGERETFRLVKQ